LIPHCIWHRLDIETSEASFRGLFNLKPISRQALWICAGEIHQVYVCAITDMGSLLEYILCRIDSACMWCGWQLALRGILAAWNLLTSHALTQWECDSCILWHHSGMGSRGRSSETRSLANGTTCVNLHS
jgi:hypothetical protein